MIDVSKIRVGDEVTVRVKVTDRVSDTAVAPVRISIFGVVAWVPVDFIATHTPKPRDFNPGDRVTWTGNDMHRWKIIAIDGELAWSKWDGYAGDASPTPHAPHFGKREMHPIQCLRHADESE